MPPSHESSPSADGRYVVVARRYRPKSFDELVGQQHVGQALCNAIETNRVGHAYLFTGARGVGKTSTARIFAKALNDPGGPTISPDGTSDVAQAIDAGEDIDVLEIDGASNRGIDEIRSLRANVGVRPSRSRYKIYIIDEVHRLTGAAFNALLKTLEEPPAHVKFIFCTTDPEKLPITVTSRCQRFDFSPVKAEEIMTRLREIVTAEGIKADDDALRLIARRAEGSMRDSQSLLEQVISFSTDAIDVQTVHTMLGTADDTRLHEIAIALAAADAAAALTLIEQAANEGIAAGQLAEQLLGYFRDVLAVAVGCPAEMQRHTGESLHVELRSLGKGWGVDRLLAIVSMIDQTIVRIRHTVHGRVLLEATLVQICHLPDLQLVADLAAALASGAPAIATPAITASAKVAVPAVAAVSAEKKNVEPSLTTSRSVSGSDLRIDTPELQAHAARPQLADSRDAHGESPALIAAGTQVAIVGDAGRQVVAAAPAARFTPAINPLAATPAPVVTKTRLQRMRDMESHEYIKQCLDIFAGEIIRIDVPKIE